MEDALTGKPDVEPVATCSSSERPTRDIDDKPGPSGFVAKTLEAPLTATRPRLTKEKDSKV